MWYSGTAMKPVSLADKTLHATSTLFLVQARSDRVREGRQLAAQRVGETERDHALARRGAHPDVIELSPIDGKERVGIDQVRDAIRAAQFSPVQGERKVCLIPSAEALTPEAANALLKTLEEPPREMAFVLLAAHTTDLLPTIVSRSRIVRLPSADQDVHADRLRERGYTDAEARWLVTFADRDGEIERFLEEVVDLPALRLTAQEKAGAMKTGDLVAACIAGESVLRRGALCALMERAASRDVSLLTEGVRTLASQARETLFAFLQDLLSVCFWSARAAEEPRSGTVEADSSTRIGAETLRAACVSIDQAHRALSVYSPAEAILLSLFLSIGGSDGG